MSLADHDVVQTLAVDSMTVQVVNALRARGVEPILLKGRSFAVWLYTEREHRFYADCDLLVAPFNRPTAEAVLATCGFVAIPLPPEPQHAQIWRRVRDGAALDLHATVWGAEDHQLAWAALSTCTEPLSFGPIDVTVLDEAGRCLQVVLHWVHHGDSAQQRTDLDRALAQVGDAAWAQAADLADRIGAGDMFRHGLVAHPLGIDLVGRLGMTPKRPPSRAHQLRMAGDETGATTLERIIGLPSWRARAAAVGRKLLPASGYLRAGVEHDQGDPPPTALLYARYWFRQVAKTPGGIRAWYSSWRALNRRHGTG